MKSKPTALDVLDAQLPQEVTSEYIEKRNEYIKLKSAFWDFLVVLGHFVQLDVSTDDTSFNYLEQQMGVATSWQAILDELKRLNEDAGDDSVYKVMYLARHGQGYHNLAHLQYGNDAWNDHWSKIDGDGTLVWGPDPELTQLGLDQARDNGLGWEAQVSAAGKEILPHHFYLSPFSRSADTLVETWKNLVDLKSKQPKIRELLREQIGLHTCDKRSPRKVIAAKYESQGFIIEEGFAEDDIYYTDDTREPTSDQALRMYRAFSEIFDETSPGDLIISVTTHSGAIRSQLLMLGHRQFAVGTGGVIPVFIKGTKRLTGQ